MNISIDRGNVPAASRPNATATLTAFEDASDLLADVQAGRKTAAQAKIAFAERVLAALAKAIEAARTSDADFDALVAAYTAEVTAAKALRPGGNF